MVVRVWSFLNSSLGLLCAGFIITTVLGTAFTTWVQNETWARQTKFALYQKRYDEGAKLLDELGSIIGLRYYRLQRLLWAIQQPEDYDLAQVSKDYFEVVNDWNVRLRIFASRLKLLVGERRALDFLDYGDDARPGTPRSLHYKFVQAHRAVMLAKADPSQREPAAVAVESLNWAVSQFMDDVASDFLDRAARLQLLKYQPTLDKAVECEAVGPGHAGATAARGARTPAARAT